MPHRVTRRLIKQKARGQTHRRRTSYERPSTACKRMVSGTISLPALGCFSPFPHGTSSLSVASECLALEDGPPGFPRDSTCPAVLGNSLQEVQTISSTGLSPAAVALSRNLRLWFGFLTSRGNPRDCPTTPTVLLPAVWAIPRSLTATRGISDLISLPRGTEMFHFPPFASNAYVFSVG